MKTLHRFTKPLMWITALLIAGFVTACGGGGSQGRDPILGMPTAALVSVAVTPATASIEMAATLQFVATATYADGATRDVTATSVWTSATPASATINSTSGLATGVAIGSSVITATFQGQSGTANLTVTAQLMSITVTPALPSIAMAVKQQFAAVGTFSNGTTRDITASAVFTSGTPAVATITAGGLATGVTAGTTVITATSGTRSGSTILTVTPAILVSIAVTPVNPTLQMGVLQQLTVIGTYSNGTSADVTSSATYTSATPSVATIDASSGIVTAGAAGTSVMTASFNGKTATTAVTVSAATLTSIAITPANPTLQIGVKQQLTVTATYSDTTTANVTNSSAFISATPSVATVDTTTGLVTAVSAGSSVMTATFNGKTANTTVTVSSATLTSIAVTPLNSTVLVGSTQQFAATANYSDGTTAVITNSVVWASSQTNVATILPNGQAVANGAGVTKITATQGAQSGFSNFTVITAAPPPAGSGGSASVNLKSAARFGVLAGNSITNNSGGTTLVTGDVGSQSQTVDPVQAAGYNNYKSGAILTTALNDLQTAITDANSRTCDVNSGAGIDLGGRTFGPGVYCYAGAISITGTFIMNGPGVYIFRTSSTLNTTANSIVGFTGGATATDVSWVPVGATTLGANSVFKGSIMGQSAAITMGDNASLQNGRVLTATAATLRNNAITIP